MNSAESGAVIEASPDHRPLDKVQQVVVSLGPTAVGILLLVALSARRYLPLATADALLPALMSTQRLTFYYWGQDRLANVVPLLACPIRDPIWNFRFQMFVYGIGFFALVAMFVWFHLHASGRRATGLVLAIASTVAGLLVLGPMRAGTGYTFVFEQVYALSLALFVPSLRLLVDGSSRSPGRLVAGVVLVLLAVLLNPTVVLVSPVVWLLDDDRDGRWRRVTSTLIVVVAAFVVYSVTSRLWSTGPDYRRYYDNFSLAGIGDAIDTTLSRVLGSVDLSISSVLGIACLVVIAARWRTLPARLRLLYAGAPVFGLAWLVVFATNEWVSMNIYAYRYFFPVYAAGVLLVSAVVAECTSLVVGALAGRRTGPPSSPANHLALLSGAVTIAMIVSGVALSKTEVDALESAAQGVETARRLDLVLVTGDYWTTWPVVLAGRDAGLDLLGVAGRSDPIVHDIKAEVQRSMDEEGVVRALCPSLDLDQCASDLSFWTERPWSASTMSESDPMVIELRPDVGS